MAFKIFQKINRLFSKRAEVLMDNGKKTNHIKVDLSQKPDEFIPETKQSKEFIEEVGKAIKEANNEAENYIPPFIQREGDNAGVAIGQAIFPPEEIAKMASMTAKERIKYKAKLLEEGKYTVNWDKQQ